MENFYSKKLSDYPEVVSKGIETFGGEEKFYG